MLNPVELWGLNGFGFRVFRAELLGGGFSV